MRLTKTISRIGYPLLLAGAALGLLLLAQAVMASNIDGTKKYAWGSNVGWINFNPADGGVTVYADHLEGDAWGENTGWIRLGTHSGGGTHTYANSSSSDYGVNVDGSGNLSGYAWGTNVGWINFKPTLRQAQGTAGSGSEGVKLDLTSGTLSGYAWGENTGWIRFSNTELGANSYQVVAQLDDGPSDSIEDGVPNPTGGANGDGNGDGTPDRNQEHVASLPNNTTGDYVTFEVDESYSFVNVHATDNPATNSAPAEAAFTQGFFNVNVTGLSVGASFQVTMTLRGDAMPMSYWKYGPTPDNNTDHWYKFEYDGTTGAVINGNTIVLHFKDGARGDSDLQENGQISDPGGPQYEPTGSTVPPAPVNQPPQMSTPLPDITVNEGAVDQFINLLNYFNDPENDKLIFTVVGNSNRDVLPNVLVGQILNNDLLRLEFGASGQTEITIQAKEDVHHKTYQDSFIVNILPASTATPTATPTQAPPPTIEPSATAIPTQISEPSATAIPTQIPEPSATAIPTQIPEPSATVIPTQISEPSATATVEPTQTATVVSTPVVDANAIQLFLPMVSR